MMEKLCINMYIVNKYLSVCNVSVSLVALWHVILVMKHWTAEVKASAVRSRVERTPCGWHYIAQSKRHGNENLVICYRYGPSKASAIILLQDIYFTVPLQTLLGQRAFFYFPPTHFCLKSPAAFFSLWIQQ